MDVTITLDGATVPLSTYWDTIWVSEHEEGDWSIADPDGKAGTQGGLASNAGLATAIILALFSDKRAPDHAVLDSADRGGWVGDRIDVRADLGETDLGSWIWLYERSALTADLPQKIVDAAIDGLEPIRRQGAVARFDVAVEMFPENDMLDLLVDAYSQDGTKIYAQRFSLLWNQV